MAANQRHDEGHGVADREHAGGKTVHVLWVRHQRWQCQGRDEHESARESDDRRTENDAPGERHENAAKPEERAATAAIDPARLIWSPGGLLAHAPRLKGLGLEHRIQCSVLIIAACQSSATHSTIARSSSPLAAASACIARRSTSQPSSLGKSSASRRSTTAFGSFPSCTMISATSTWSNAPCNLSTTRSARGCHPCLRYVLLPMSPVWTIEKWCPGAELNHRHRDFQSRALPTELPGRRAEAGAGLSQKSMALSRPIAPAMPRDRPPLSPRGSRLRVSGSLP